MQINNSDTPVFTNMPFNFPCQVLGNDSWPSELLLNDGHQFFLHITTFISFITRPPYTSTSFQCI